MADRTEHLIMLIGMMGSTSSAGDGEGVNAFRMATRELEKQGITWRDIAERALLRSASQSGMWHGSPPPKREREPERHTYSPPPPPPPPPAEPERVRATGFDIPPAISGVVRILDDDKKSQLMIVEVEGKDYLYGPMIAYAGTVRDNLIMANNRQSTLRVRPPRSSNSIPQIVACRYI